MGSSVLKKRISENCQGKQLSKSIEYTQGLRGIEVVSQCSDEHEPAVCSGGQEGQ